MSSICEKISISHSASIADAMNTLEQTAMQIVLVVDDGNHLVGTITDGDIRRGLLNGIELKDTVDKVMRKNPMSVPVGTSRDEVFSILSINKIHHLPVVDDQGRLVDLEVLDKIIGQSRKDNLIILMAGGFGRRLGDLTKSCPKPLLNVGNRPILETIILNFIKQGYWNFLISVNYRSEMIEQHFGDGSQWGVKINYLHEEQPMGTAGALSLIEKLPTSPFIVMNADLLTSVNFDSMLEFHTNHKAMATMGVREYEVQIPYGVVNTEKDLIQNIDEKPVHRFFVNAGIYVLEPDAVQYVPQNQFFDMPHLFNEILKQEKNVSSFPVHEYWIDIGIMSELEKAKNEYSQVFSHSEIHKDNQNN